MKRSQRLRLIPIALVALSTALPGAVGHAAPAGTHAAAKVDVRFANFIDAKQLPAVQKLILPAYYKAYPNANVAFEAIPDARVKSVTQIAAGTAADVFNLGDGDVGWYEDKNALKDLTPYANAAHFSFSQYIPSTLILGHVGSHQYSLPKDYSSLAVYYNKDMFKAAGLPFPSANWTWDEFRRDAIKLTKNGVMGFTGGGDWSRLVDAVARSLGGRLISADGRKVVGYMNSAASVKAIQFWVDLFNKDKVALTPTAAKAVNGDQFASQKAAMSINGVWPSVGDTAYRKTLKFNWAVAPFPRGTSPANTICYAGFVMSRTTKHPKEAWGLIQYMSGPVGDRFWATNGLPAVKSVADSTGASHDPVASVFLKAASFTNLPDDLNGPAAPQGVGDTLTEGLDLLLGNPGTSVSQVLTIEANKGQKAINSYFGH